MELPVVPPLAPMLGRLARELPGEGFLYEPKWDGFRCLVFRCREDVDMRSRHDRPLARYFPELVAGLRSLPAERFVLDGEVVVLTGGRFDFPGLMARLHPAASRVERLRRETPALFIAFDLLALEDDDLRERPFAERRERLAELLRPARPPIFLTPLSDDAAVAAAWLERFEGVVAKERGLLYEAGKRAMVKVKKERTADCVVGGFRWMADQPLPSSLLLGLYDDEGELQHVGIVQSFTQPERRRLLDEIAPHVVPLAGHPWERGFLTGRSPLGRLKGAAGRWIPGEMERDWVPVAPELVCEVRYDQVDGNRFRHPARFLRWRPDRAPRSCAFDQLGGAETVPLP